MTTRLEIRPLEPFGAEIFGGSPTMDFDEAQTTAIKEALWRHHLLVFRGERRTDEQLLGFAGRFGTVSTTPGLDIPLIHTVGTHIPDSPTGILKNTDFEWHTDGSVYVGSMGKESLLQGDVIPSRGGDTQLVSTYEVYEALPNALKARLDGVRAVFDQSGYTQGFHTREARVVHPLVVTHPDSGRRCLYIQPYATIGILDLPPDEGHDLLVELIDLILKPERIYTHRWRVGDLLLFDTWGTWHRRDSWDPTEPRGIRFVATQHPVPVFPIPADAPRPDLEDSSMVLFGVDDARRDPRQGALDWARRQRELAAGTANAC